MRRNIQKSSECIFESSRDTPRRSPKISPRKQATETISPDQFKSLMEKNKNLIILDARFPFEYEQGHIINSINVWNDTTLAQQMKPFDTWCSEENRVVVVYCEFSKTRGPKIANLLQEMDFIRMESLGLSELNFPEVYLLEGGFKYFYENVNELCTGKYISMRNINSSNIEDLRNYATQIKTRPRCPVFNNSPQITPLYM
ncbi:dual specificity phosphatase ibp1, putative [Entamoeba invadens IP1]|uniref:dual specificity phosphatase ibp1, putative n=1 Tax=Entamoeba invadens IP1 TaxID=370355 RepID=UPI0002C3F6F2|nr:dual specificity phosphatase ibp1, putative [Entamoeba invadens IP1]ELP93111.1 dual specificity phosphatase ibp1, putative [Entamoeba invadens IP1]|eukprot:XP_004259882.1 dual specificity phosphatase ibp1, putative [Entamoeba invadens IP1]